MRSLVRTSVVLLITTGAYLAFRTMGDSSRLLPGSGIDPDLVEALLKVGFWVVPSVLAVRVLHRVGYGGVVGELGLRRRVIAGYGLGLAAMLPMAVLVAAVGPTYSRVVSFVGIALVGPFAEEVLFRGFLLRQLYRRCGWPPLWAIVASALAFGLAHLSNVDWIGPGLTSAIASEMLTTIGGGLLFGWLAWRWDSIWPAIGLHSCLNLGWALTGASYGALVAYRLRVPAADGALLVNTMRFAAVVIALSVTLLATRTARRARLSADVTAAPALQ